MVIKKRNIRNVSRYLWEFKPGEELYVSSPLSDKDLDRLTQYGLTKPDVSWVPAPGRSATSFNADGKWKVLKDLPKEPRTFEHCYHLVGWNGVDYYGICYSVRQCYQRELIPPLELAFLVHDGRLYSEPFTNSESDFPKIKLAINIVLELMGQCELLNIQKQPPLPARDFRTLHWEILRPGKRTPKDIITHLTKTRELRRRKVPYAIIERHEFLNSMAPDFCAVGTQNFAGYVVYGFSGLDLYIFECDVTGNATYIFRGDWESASKLTKTEILTGNLQEARLFHTENWKQSVQSFLHQ